MEEGLHDVVVVYSINFGATPINYTAPTSLSEDWVQEMKSHTTDNFVEKQRRENK